MRFSDSGVFNRLVAAIFKNGVKIIVITMTTPVTLLFIDKACSLGNDEILIGIGTRLESETTRQAVESGVQFVVSPVIKKEIIRKAQSAGVPVMPGAFTPPEVQTAWELGADVVKILPANLLGMNFFKGIRASMPHLKLMSTGRVFLTNARGWIDAGACALGVKSILLDDEAIKNKNFDQIRKNAEVLVSILKGFKGL
ncbi:bifunctional 4-hydroxy-2-oxoglutarate aldolase/2-dehydro-3-deoxy-phosphogluconate aldolase [soil metagenome]